MKKKIEPERLIELSQMLEGWIRDDLVMATFVSKYIEKHNPAFLRGVRYGLYHSIKEIERIINEQ